MRSRDWKWHPLATVALKLPPFLIPLRGPTRSQLPRREARSEILLDLNQVTTVTHPLQFFLQVVNPSLPGLRQPRQLLVLLPR